MPSRANHPDAVDPRALEGAGFAAWVDADARATLRRQNLPATGLPDHERLDRIRQLTRDAAAPAASQEAAADPAGVLPRLPLSVLDTLARMPVIGRGCEADVYLDVEQGAVYKLFVVGPGGGVEALSLAPFAMGQRGAPTAPARHGAQPLAGYLIDLLDASSHPAVVYVEPVGLLAGGFGFLLKQPYIADVRFLSLAAADALLDRLGLVSLSRIDPDRMVAKALGRLPDGRAYLFGDLHGHNVVVSGGPGPEDAGEAQAKLNGAELRLEAALQDAGWSAERQRALRRRLTDTADPAVAPAALREAAAGFVSAEAELREALRPSGTPFLIDATGHALTQAEATLMERAFPEAWSAAVAQGGEPAPQADPPATSATPAFDDDGYRLAARDPPSGRPTAIAAGAADFVAPSGARGVPANPGDFPAAARRRLAVWRAALSAPAADPA